MAKSTEQDHPVLQQRVVVVHVPKDKALAALLLGSGGQSEKSLNVLSGAADPTSGAPGAVTFLAHEAGPAGRGVAALLGRTPPEAPGRDALALLAGQLPGAG